MAYQINELETGMFEVVRCEPVVVGILNDRGVAELFADFLDTLHSLDRETLSAFVPDAPAAEPEPVAEPAEVTDLAPAETPSPEAEPEAPAVEAPLMPSETPLEEALRRLEAGEKLGAVADDLRLPMTMLRGTWAKWCRDNRTPGGGAMQREEVNCRLCDRSIKVSVGSDPLCARCARDLGDHA